MEIPSSSLLTNAHPPTITICTDASYNMYTHMATWACYIRSDKRLVKTGKVIESYIENSSEAERVGVANALWLANRLVDLKTHKIIFYCDNLSALNPVKPSTKTGQKKQRAKEQLAFYQKNIEPYFNKSLSFEIRHVKAHLSPNRKRQKRHFMQEWCDKEAKRLLSECRDNMVAI